MPFASGIYYFEHGAEATGSLPLVLIHGAGGNCLFWPSNLRRIAGSRVLALDLPGHGRSGGKGERSIESYAERVIEFLDALGMECAIIGGHSMGSAIALWLALERPQRIVGLILLGAGARLRVNPEIMAKCASEMSYQEAVSLIVSHSFCQSSPRRLIELAEKHMEDVPQEVLYGDFLACDSFDVMDRVGEIRQPVLVICGEEDHMTPLRYAHYLIERIGDALLEIVPGAGHMVMLEQPRRVEEKIFDFINNYWGS